jgi:hypothetical protein
MRGGRIRRWIRRQVDEIARDPTLRYYGAALAAINVVTFVHWMFQARIGRYLVAGSVAICWPFWESCELSRVLSAVQVDVLLWVYLALSVATGLCFLLPRRIDWAWWGLLAINAIRVLIVVQDFRLRLNQHYMANGVVLAYLLFPAKRTLVPALLVSFYFWAGVLKLDQEWLSGQALYGRDRFWVPAALVPASCVYVVVMEILLVFGVFARRAWVFWATMGQLVLFHIFSWTLVGFYYPLLMFGLLSIFVSVRLLEPPERWPSLGGLASHRFAALLLLGTFAVLQMVPWAFPGDTALTGEGRLFALHMFDAKVECEASQVLHLAKGADKEIPVEFQGLATRIKCDPVVFLSLARAQCRDLARLPNIRDFDFRLKSRRSSDPEFHDVMNVKDFCQAGLSYDMWRPNDWILKSSSAGAGRSTP